MDITDTKAGSGCESCPALLLECKSDYRGKECLEKRNRMGDCADPLTRADIIRQMDDESIARSRVKEVTGMLPVSMWAAQDVSGTLFFSRTEAVNAELEWLRAPGWDMILMPEQV